MITPRVNKSGIPERTLESLSAVHCSFLQDGGNLKKAKLHNNVIGFYFFDIPLTQV